jgi:hypothetical protein
MNLPLQKDSSHLYEIAPAIKKKMKAKFNLEEPTKARRGRNDTVLLFL